MHKWYFTISQDGEEIALELRPFLGGWEGSRADFATAIEHGLFLAGEKSDEKGRFIESPFDFDGLVEAARQRLPKRPRLGAEEKY